jgi:hypothetical protein
MCGDQTILMDISCLPLTNAEQLLYLDIELAFLCMVQVSDG